MKFSVSPLLMWRCTGRNFLSSQTWWISGVAASNSCRDCVSVFQFFSVSLFLCFSFSVFQCSSVSVVSVFQLFKCFCVSVFQYFSFSVFLCFSVSLFLCFSVSLFQCFCVSVFLYFCVSVFQCFSVRPMFHHCLQINRLQKPQNRKTKSPKPKSGDHKSFEMTTYYLSIVRIFAERRRCLLIFVEFQYICFNYQLNAQFVYSIKIYICYIIIPDMFRAVPCSSSVGQIVLSQHLVSSLSVQYSTESDDTRCCDNTICSSEDGHVNARNMSRIIMLYIYIYIVIE